MRFDVGCRFVLCVACLSAGRAPAANLAATEPPFPQSRSDRPTAHFVVPPPSLMPLTTPPPGPRSMRPVDTPATPDVINDPLPPAFWSALSMFALAGVVRIIRGMRRRLS